MEEQEELTSDAAAVVSRLALSPTPLWCCITLGRPLAACVLVSNSAEQEETEEADEEQFDEEEETPLSCWLGLRLCA